MAVGEWWKSGERVARGWWEGGGSVARDWREN